MHQKSRRNTRQVLTNLTLSIVSLLVIFIVAEFAMRFAATHWVSPRKQEIYRSYTERKKPMFEPHPYLAYAPTKNYVSLDDENENIHNAYGFRGPEIIVPKPDGVYRIVAVGGSTTYSTAVPSWKDAYPTLLGEILRERYGYENVEVINAGVGGYTTAETLINFLLNVTEVEPDMLLIYNGINDVHERFVCPEDFKSDYSGFRKYWSNPKYAILYRSLLVQLVGYKTGLLERPNVGMFVNTDAVEKGQDNLFGDQNVPIEGLCGESRLGVLEKNTAKYFERNLENLIIVARARNITPVLATFARDVGRDNGHYSATEAYIKALEEHNDILRALGGKYGLLVIPFAEAVENGLIPTGKQRWQGIHLKAEGTKLKAQFFASYLDTVLLNAR